MSLDAREVHRVAALARLRLSLEEEGRFTEQLSRVVEHIDRIGSYGEGEVERAEPAPGPEFDDEPGDCLEHERFLANAPAVRDAFLIVPRVLGSDDG